MASLYECAPAQPLLLRGTASSDGGAPSALIPGLNYKSMYGPPCLVLPWPEMLAAAPREKFHPLNKVALQQGLRRLRLVARRRCLLALEMLRNRLDGDLGEYIVRLSGCTMVR